MIIKNLPKIYLLTLFIGFFTQINSSQNEIYYLISTPRSSLVEFLRMVGQSNAFRVMHIPGNWAYCHAHNYTELCKGWYRNDAPTNYTQVKDEILKEAAKAKVFVGENTHTANDFLIHNKEFTNSPQTKFIFLVRNPHGAIIEYYEKKKSYFDKLPQSQLSESIGLKNTYNLLQELKKSGNHSLLIIKSEDLYFKMRETVQTICKYLNIPFSENLINWKDLSANFVSFPGWHTIELTDCAKTWHMNAISSTSFTRPSVFAVDKDNNPTFEEVTNTAHRKICIDAYKENVRYYNLFFNLK